MANKKFIRESQEAVLAALEDMEEGSAYDVMDVVAANLEGNKAFAMRQRVSGACSELHSENRVHKVGMKTNPSSGEVVNVYRVNSYPDQACPCGACPGGGETAYKAKYEQAMVANAELKERIALIEHLELCGGCTQILCIRCHHAREKLIKAVA